MSRVRVPDHDGECWIWTGTLRHGYGQLSVGGRTQAAHRLAWELFRGPIPGRLKVLHNCPGGDNPACVNPAHLFLGTQADNVRDMLVKGRNDPVVGERHPKAKLTPEAVREIRALYAAGKANQYELAARFGVGQSTIGRVVRGKGWYHVS